MTTFIFPDSENLIELWFVRGQTSSCRPAEFKHPHSDDLWFTTDILGERVAKVLGVLSQEIKALPEYNPGPESYQISPKWTSQVLEAIVALQKEHPRYVVSEKDFLSTLQELVWYRYLTKEQMHYYLTNIHYGLSYGAFTNKVKETKNLEQALELIQYHLREENSSPGYAFHWLWLANKWMKERGEDITQVFDVAKFFEGWSSIDSEWRLFDRDSENLLLLAAQAPIETLKFSGGNFTSDWTTQIGLFMTACKTLKRVEFNSHSHQHALTEWSIKPLALALALNTTLESVSFKDARLEDGGGLAVVGAIDQNPKSVIRIVDLSGCFLSSKVKEHAKRTLTKRGLQVLI